MEEDFADNAMWSMKLLSRDQHVMPWRIEAELKRIGANFAPVGFVARFRDPRWQSHHRATEFSSEETARLMLET